MEIKYILHEDDYLHFNLYHIKNSKTSMKVLKLQRYLTPLLYLIAAYIFALLTDGSYILSFSIFLTLSVLWIIYYPKYYYNHVRRNVRKFLKEGNNDGLLGEHIMVFTEDGIVDRNQTGETKVVWEGIHTFKEDEHYFYLYNSAVSAYILPKKDVENANEVRNLLESKTQPSS